MKITGLEIDGYGVWTGLKLEGLSDGLNVLYGPNEAGKTTLLQFIRSALYGFSPATRKYFPPLRGGRPGGSIDLGGSSGRFQLRRHDDGNGDGRDSSQGQLALIAADGTLQGEHLVKTLLSDVDEAVYNNVFAVGLREMQQLNTLSDTEAAELLYRLTAGLDRVSLVDVMRELQTSRNRILDAGGGSSQVVQLLQRREQLRLELEELGKLTHRYARLAAEREQLQRELGRLEADRNQVEHQARVVELAGTLRERFARRAALDDELAALGPSAAMPPGAVERLDALNSRLHRHRQLADQAQRQRAQLRSEAAGLVVNEALWRQAARIEALLEQQPWIATLQNQIGELEAEIAEIQSSLAAERQQLGLGSGAAAEALTAVSPQALSRLGPPARLIKHCRRRIGEAEQQAAAARQNAETLSGQIASALSQRDQRDLAAALDEAGDLVAQLRRRVQIDERLDQMARYETELESQSRRLLGRQLMPVWVLLVLGAVFVVGVVLVMAGLFMPTSITGSVGWAMAVLGLAGSGAAGAGKVMLERSNARQLESCQKQLNMLQLQTRQAQQEREALDQRLAGGERRAAGGGQVAGGGRVAGGGAERRPSEPDSGRVAGGATERRPSGSDSCSNAPLCPSHAAGRLQTAEKELAALEQLVPLEAQCTAARQEAQAATERVAQAEEELGAARRRWRQALTAAGLPESLTPKQVRGLMRRCDVIGQVHRRWEDRREELARRRRELDSLLGRITQLVADSQAAVSTGDPIEQLRQLGEAIQQQEACLARRRELVGQARRLRTKQAKHAEAVSRLRHRRRELLREAGAADEQQFRQRAVQAARGEVLRQEREALTREITSALGGACAEDAVRRQLEDGATTPLEARRDQLRQRLAAIDQELRQRHEQRGRLAEQLKTLADNQELPAKRLELATLQKRLEDAIGRWQVLAVTNRVLDVIRTTYEKQRQPETLQEASVYLSRLTQGRYRRVWTPLGEQVLRVDDAEGNSLPVEVLSRGAREQLFLSLRLALAACYARRGAPLPLVLDDVLVNFDAARAKAAAAVLRDFAAAGHQVLVFTCHEHIFKLFSALKVPVSRLPDCAEAEHAPVTFQQPSQKKTRHGRKADHSPVKLAAEAGDDLPLHEIPTAEDEDDEQEWVEADDEEDEDEQFEDRGTAEAA